MLHLKVEFLFLVFWWINLLSRLYRQLKLLTCSRFSVLRRGECCLQLLFEQCSLFVNLWTLSYPISLLVDIGGFIYLFFHWLSSFNSFYKFFYGLWLLFTKSVLLVVNNFNEGMFNSCN